jgi:cell division protein FtsQ
MLFRAKKNRRRLDVAKKTGELTAAAKSHAPTFFKVLAILVVSIGLSWGGREGWRWATTTERLSLTQVVVTGETRASEAEVIRLGTITLGSNLVSMDVGAMERAIGTHPWVKSVRVHRQLPHGLRVEVVEHEPVALLALGDLYLVNEEAEPFKRIKATELMDLPLVTGIDREAFMASRDQSMRLLRRAVDAAAQYSKSKAGSMPLSEVHVTLDELTVVTTSGQEVRFADGELSPALERLERVRAELKNRSQSAEVIRLDNRARPNWVTVQLTGERPEKGERTGK